jgi:hypothetical protein
VNLRALVPSWHELIFSVLGVIHHYAIWI